MAGTTYNTLNLTTEVEAPKENSTKKVAIVAAVVVACCAMFFAGRTVARPVAYSHEEVVNVGRICAEEQFIGECIDCRECEDYEYANGGCSFFKDTFCTYCEPIANCQRENTVCTNRVDQTCSQCTCDDPISSWDDISKEAYADRPVEGTPTFSCYIGEQCEPCEPCKEGFYEVSACDPSTNTPTMCRQCQECEAGTYVASVCTYTSDTVCERCNECEAYFTTVENGECTGDVSKNTNDVLVAGHDTECRDCSRCDDDVEFVSDTCEARVDTKCKQCEECEEDFYRARECQISAGPMDAGMDTVCAECSDMEDPDTCGCFLATLCEPMGDTDFSYNACNQCVFGEYVARDCFYGNKNQLGSDRVCRDCGLIEGCPNEFVQCTSPDDSECSRCKEPGQGFEQFDDEYYRNWHTCCSDKALGDQCGWKHHENGCDQDSRNFMERTSASGGFRGSTGAEFVLWCRDMCADYDQCTAFEVEDCIADNSCEPSRGTLCALKDHIQSDEFAFGAGPAPQACWVKP